MDISERIAVCHLLLKLNEQNEYAGTLKLRDVSYRQYDTGDGTGCKGVRDIGCDFCNNRLTQNR